MVVDRRTLPQPFLSHLLNIRNELQRFKPDQLLVGCLAAFALLQILMVTLAI